MSCQWQIIDLSLENTVVIKQTANLLEMALASIREILLSYGEAIKQKLSTALLER